LSPSAHKKRIEQEILAAFTLTLFGAKMKASGPTTGVWGTLAGAVLVLIISTVPVRLNGQSDALSLGYQLTHSYMADPTLSPDGKRMVFISVTLGREQLFAMNLDGSAPIQLTHDDADHEDPAWSPDGSKIAFVLSKGDVERIYLMNADGTGRRPLTPVGIRTIHPNWSPDGTRIAYCTDDDLKPPYKNPAEVYSIEVSSGRITRLISGGVNTYPAWSPDGKKMAFRRMLGEMNSEVFLANSDGSAARNLTKHPAFDGWPAWSPDGSRIAFASNRNANYQIFVMNQDGTDVQLVANTEVGRRHLDGVGTERSSISPFARRSTSGRTARSLRQGWMSGFVPSGAWVDTDAGRAHCHLGRA
jgi:TolB protein